MVWNVLRSKAVGGTRETAVTSDQKLGGIAEQSKMDSTVRYLGVELEDALAIAEAAEL